MKTKIPTAVLAALVLGLFGAGCATTAQAQPMGSATRALAASPGQENGRQLEWLRILAFTDTPVVEADVRVSLQRSQGRPLVEVHAATNKYGAFAVAVPRHLSSFRVTVSSGTLNDNPFPWHLSADVVVTDPAHQIVVVNPVTTLVSSVLDERPDLKLDGAEARVRTFLTLPVNYPLGLALRQGSHYTSRFFSAAAFLTEAQAAGGLDAFEHLLLQELASDSTHSFRKSNLLGDTTSTATTLVETGLEAAVLDYAGSENAANLTGWAMGQSGLSSSGVSEADISALVDALTELQSEIEDLSNQLAQLNNLVKTTATQTQYNTIVVPAQALAAQVNGVESDLAYFANACPPLPDGSTPTPSDFCTNQKISVNDELNDVTIQQAYVTMETYIEDNSTTGFSGMLHLYSLYLGESRAFFRPADSTQMQNLYNYWDSALTQAANLKVELLHENGAQDNSGGQKQLTDFLGNPTLSPPTTGSFQANQATNQKLMFPSVPAGTVVSTVDHTMWSILPLAWDGDLNAYYAPVYYPQFSCKGDTKPYPTWIPVPQGATLKQGYAGFSDWSFAPSLAQSQAAVRNAPPLSSGTDWMQWLIAETQTSSDESPTSAGFQNIEACAGAPYGAWTTDQNSAGGWVMLPNQDTFVQELGLQYNFDFPVRTLKGSEQYFWYQ